MIQPAPDWISFDAKTEGLDLLGLRAPVQRIGNQLFDGITTVTRKLRYLSVLTWIVHRYSEARLPDAWQSFVRFAEAQEAMIVMANRLKSRTILNLVGVTKADALLDAGQRTLPLGRLAQNIAFNIYVTASRQLRRSHGRSRRGLSIARSSVHRKVAAGPVGAPSCTPSLQVPPTRFRPERGARAATRRVQLAPMASVRFHTRAPSKVR